MIILFLLQTTSTATTAVESGKLVLSTVEIVAAVFGIIVLVVVGAIFLKNRIPEKLSEGWKKTAELDEKHRTAIEYDLAKVEKERDLYKDQIIDLTRELDIRREINRQDTTTIKDLKEQLAQCEQTNKNLRDLQK